MIIWKPFWINDLLPEKNCSSFISSLEQETENEQYIKSEIFT